MTANGDADKLEDFQIALRDAVRESQWRKEAIKFRFYYYRCSTLFRHGQNYEYSKILREAKSK